MSEDLRHLKPKDHGEQVALFRLRVLGSLTCAQLEHGEQAERLRVLSRQRFRAPQADATRTYSVATLERWLSAHRKGGLEALRPESRERGNALELSEEHRSLLLEIRREYPSASVPLILDTLVREGVLQQGVVEASAVRRLLARNGLGRQPWARQRGKRERRRWQAERPGQLWHADVCHGPNLTRESGRLALRIHAILDDASRTIVALSARSSEREVDMLELMTAAIREHGKPDELYLDNGSTYRGEALELMCARLGITLLHAKPYDPQARGKMERFWRTLREGCLDFISPNSTLHEVQVRLLAFVDRLYQVRPHAGLMGRTPASVWASKSLARASEDDLHEALTVRARRKVNGDGTLKVGGLTWEVEAGWLVRQSVDVARSFADPQSAPWIEHEGRRHPLRLVDPVQNGKQKRAELESPTTGLDAIRFDPNRARLDELLGRKPKGGGK